MKKHKTVFAAFLALTVTISLFGAAGCRKSFTSQSESESAQETTSEPETTTSETTVETTTEATSSESETSAESSETTEPTTISSDSDSSSGVKVNWDAYTPGTSADPVFTRLSEEYIEDFIPGNDYGAVIPYFGASIYSYSDLSTVGFFDVSGRIICDTVFDYLRITDNGYFVTQFSKEQNRKPVLADPDLQKMGYISLDGSVYTSLSFNEYIYIGGEYCCIRYTQEGVEYFNLDYATGKEKNLRSLKIDRNSIDSTDVDLNNICLGKILENRYLVFCDREYDNVVFLIDGETGLNLSLPEVSDDGRIEYRDQFLILCDYSSDNNPYTYMRGNGEVLFENGNYRECNDLYLDDEHCMMMYRDDGWDILDKDRKLHCSLDNKDGSITWLFLYQNHYFIATKSDSYLVYDTDFNLVHETKRDPSLYYEFIDEDREYYYFKTVDSGPVVMTSENGKSIILDLLTGEQLEFDGEWNAYISAVFDNRIILQSNIGEENPGEWKLIDRKDGHVLTEGKGRAEVVYDFIAKKYYVSVSDYEETFLTTLDPETGDTLIENFVHPLKDHTQLFYYANGNPIVHTKLRSNHEYPYTTSTTMLSPDGKILFMYYPMQPMDD
ncbi:MAG: hypothetical protein IKG93_06730 [Clostridiales bacterium]|nr:hypothetical protein [Clostridiales bacterium]